MPTRLATLLAAVALLLALLTLPEPARGGYGKSSTIDSQLRGLAKKIADIAADRKEKAVHVSVIAGPEGAPGGAFLQGRLAKHLAGFGIAVDRDAEVIVNGKYVVLPESESKDGLHVKLTLEAREQTGGKALGGPLEVTINHRGNDDLAALLGLTADFRAQYKSTLEDRNERLLSFRQKPSWHVDAGKVKVQKESHFSVEVLVKDKAVGAKAVKEAVFVELPEGTEFAVRLHNDMKTDAAVVLLIDGVPLHQFDGPEDKQPEALLLESGKARTIDSWPLGGKKERFKAGKLRALPGASYLRPDARMGTITVLFYPTWEKSPPAQFEGPRCGAGTPTRLDAEGKKPLQWFSGALLEAVTLRYKRE